jgi:hypothetical protein
VAPEPEPAPQEGVRVIMHAQAERPARVIVLDPACPAPLGREKDGFASGDRRAAAPAEGGSEGSDESPWLRLETDSLVFGIAETYGLFRVRLTSLEASIQDVRLELFLRGVAGVEIHPVTWQKPKIFKPGEFSVTIPPLKQGAYAVGLSLRFKNDRCAVKCAANTELYVYPAESSVRQVAENIVFNITNDIRTGHAADVHLSQNAADVVGTFAHNGAAHSLTELLNLLKTDQRAYRMVSLLEEECVPVTPRLSAPPAGSQASRLTLSDGGRLVHLLAGHRLTLGRNRENGVVTRLFGGAGKEPGMTGERISKFHCMIELEGGDCVIHDGTTDECGRRKPSSCGTFWQGHEVHGATRFPVDTFPRRASLGLAGTAAAHDFGLTAHGCFFDASHCAACVGRGEHSCHRGRVPAVVLRRTDSVPECYALLWACLDLGEVIPGCSGAVICYEQGAFSWRSGGSSGWLTPGSPVTLGGKTIDVRAFAQYGL